MIRKVAGIGDKDVEITVVVIVEKGDPGAHALRHVARFLSILLEDTSVVFEIYIALRGDIGEDEGRLGRCHGRCSRMCRLRISQANRTHEKDCCDQFIPHPTHKPATHGAA